MAFAMTNLMVWTAATAVSLRGGFLKKSDVGRKGAPPVADEATAAAGQALAFAQAKRRANA